MGKMDEQILVVNRAWLFGIGDELAFQGLLTNEEQVDLLLQHIDEGIQVKRRGDAEEDKKFKQPIPYAIIKRGQEVFLYERLQGGGEARLHNQLSIGVGGHMNDDGGSFNEQLWSNLKRELSEELIIDVPPTEGTHIKTVGLINDDENEVGTVHIGLLVVVDLPPSATVEVRETEQLNGSWVRVQDLRKSPLFENLESWSQIAVEALDTN